MPDVIVIGAGGIGVLTAVSLCHNGSSNVSLVVRSDYRHVQQYGYRIQSAEYGVLDGWKPHRIYSSVHAAVQDRIFYDYVVVTTKNIPDGPVADRVPQVIEPILQSNMQLGASAGKLTCVLLVQNGIDIERDVAAMLQQKNMGENVKLLSGIQMVGSTKIAPGVIDQINLERLIVGAFQQDDAQAIEAAKSYVALYSNKFNKERVDFEPNVRQARWQKLLYNAAINTTTALVGLDVPRCFAFSSSNNNSTEELLFRPAMKEIIAIAKSEGIELNPNTIDYFIDVAKKHMFKPSMCVDADKGQLLELEVILGNPIRIAQQNGVATPTLSMLYNLLILLQGKLKEQNKVWEFNEATLTLNKEN